MKRKKIVLFGLFGQQNLGNECTLQAMLYHVRKSIPDAEISCICTGPEDTRSRHGIPAFEMYPASDQGGQDGKNFLPRFLLKITAWAWREVQHGVRAFKTLRGSDLVIVPGTGLLVDHTTGFRGYPYYIFKWAIIAKLCRCKFLIVSIGAGPISHPLSKFFIKTALSLADYRSYRDTFSKVYIESIGFVRSDDPIYPDLAFSLPENTIHEGRRSDTSRTVVGVGLIDYFGQGSKHGWAGRDVYCDYINKTGAFITWLLDNNYRVRLVIGDIGCDMTAIKDVLEFIEKRGGSCGDVQIIHEPIISVEELLTQLARTDIVVSPRFHNIILALMLKKRVISLSYNEKFESLMLDFGLERYCQRLDELDVNGLIELLTSLERDHDNLALRISKRTEECRRALEEQYKAIFKGFGSCRTD